MSSQRRGRRRRTFALGGRLSRAVLAFCVVGSTLAVGAMHVPVLVILCLLLGLSATFALVGTAEAPRLPPAIWLVAAGGALTAFQVLPLPFHWLSALARANAEIWEGALEPLKEGPPPWVTLSLDPGATWVELLKTFGYFCAFLAAARAGARRGAAWGALVLIGSALVLALCTLAHRVVDAETLFGVYRPQTGARGWKIAPLVNPNNLAGYLNLGILCGGSLMAAKEPPVSRWWLALAIGLLTAVSVLTGSRGGLLSLAGGLVVLALLLRRLPETATPPKDWARFALVTAGAVGFGALLAFAAFGKRVIDLLRDDDVSKLGVAISALRLTKQHGLLGIGRGAFESVFPAIRLDRDNLAFSHPENFVAQWAVEWGLPAALSLLVLGALWLRPQRWGVGRSAAACGLFAACSALLVQNLADLSLEVPAVALAAVVAAGCALGAQEAEAPNLHRRPVWSWPALVAVGAIAIVGVVWKGRHTLNLDKLSAQAMTSQVDKAAWPELKGALRDAMLRHPAEPYFPRLGAAAAFRTGAESPLPWLGRALDRGMTSGRTHFLLGSYLASLGRRSQALMELRYAVGYDPDLTSRAARVATKLTESPSQLLRTVPEGVGGISQLVALTRAVGSDYARASIFLREALSRDPSAPGPLRLDLNLLLNALERAQAPCAGETRADCVRRAEQHVGALSKEAREEELVGYRSRLLMLQGRSTEALQMLREACPRFDNRLRCYRAAIDAARANRDLAAVAELAKAIQSEPCAETAECSNALWKLGQVARDLSAADMALNLYELAANAEPTATRWMQVAKAAEAERQFARAVNALHRAQILSPTDSKVRREIDRVRLRLLVSPAGQQAP